MVKYKTLGRNFQATKAVECAAVEKEKADGVIPFSLRIDSLPPSCPSYDQQRDHRALCIPMGSADENWKMAFRGVWGVIKAFADDPRRAKGCLLLARPPGLAGPSKLGVDLWGEGSRFWRPKKKCWMVVDRPTLQS